MIATLNNKTRFDRRKVTSQDINNNTIKRYDKYCAINGHYGLRNEPILVPLVSTVNDISINNSNLKFIYLRNVDSISLERRIMGILKQEPNKELLITVK